MLTARDFKQIVSGRRQGVGASLLRGLMWGTSLVYGIGVGIRNRQYDTGSKPAEKADVPVISVGNLTLGGTGKTPMVAWLARWFRQRNLRVTLISRGYGAEEGSQNDEAKELEQRLSFGQFEKVWAACLQANLGTGDSPKSAAGRILRQNAESATTAAHTASPDRSS